MEITHTGFIIEYELLEDSPNIIYPEAGLIVEKDEEYWFEFNNMDVEGFISFIGFHGFIFGFPNADYLYAEYLEGLDV